MVTFFDNKTRDWHADAHNQTVDFEKSFEVGGELMQRPGEGSARNVVNCRWYGTLSSRCRKFSAISVKYIY